MNVVCPRCLATNRVPDRRLAEHPKCGKCGAALLDGAPAELDQAGFERFLAGSEMPLVVDFWAPWCGPCRAMAPVFAQVAAEFALRARFVKINTEQEQTLAARYGIRSIPTLALFQGGAEADRSAGAMGADGLRSWLTARLR